MNNNTRLLLGIVCIVMGLFWPNIKDLVPEVRPEPDPIPKIVIDKPNDSVLSKVSPVADLVTDDEDRINLAVFNNVFSERVDNYDADAQQVNDVYVEAAKNIFGDTLKGKYIGYGENINKLLESSLGTENHTVTANEKDNLSQNFKGLAYSLAN